MALMIMCQDNTENRRIAGEQGAIQAVVDALNRHRGNKEVQANGQLALASMCKDNTENRRIAGEQGAIQAVVDALNRHRGNKEVQANGQLALASMCKDNTENRRIVDVWANSKLFSTTSIRATRALNRSSHVIFCICNKYPQLKKLANSKTRFLLGFSVPGFPTEELRAGRSRRRHHSSTPPSAVVRVGIVQVVPLDDGPTRAHPRVDEVRFCGAP